nr:CP20k-like protein 1 [Conchoderma hunteri]
MLSLVVVALAHKDYHKKHNPKNHGVCNADAPCWHCKCNKKGVRSCNCSCKDMKCIGKSTRWYKRHPCYHCHGKKRRCDCDCTHEDELPCNRRHPCFHCHGKGKKYCHCGCEHSHTG